jgi:ADP-ribose pyrophosphatase YjhB (NUDIX family)
MSKLAPDCRVHKLVADVVLRSGDRVLMVRYRDTRKYDGQRGWFLPDDYLAHLEHPAEAARRIVREQVGVEAPELQLAVIESFGDGAWHLVFHYAGELDDPAPISTSGNVAAAEWFALDALPDASEVAHDGWALDVLRRLRGR